MNMDAGAKKWMIKHCWLNYWRVASWYEIDDLIQDGYMCWWQVVQYYPDAKNTEHLMRLFQVTFTNHVHTLSNTKTKDSSIIPISDCLHTDKTEATFLERHSAVADDLHGLAHAPRTVRDAIYALIQNADKLRKPSRMRSNGTRQTTNEKLCAITGCNPSMIDLVAEIKYCLGS